MKVTKDICYKDIANQAHMLDIYLPDSESFPVFIYFHGGGFEEGSKSRPRFYEALAEKGVAVVTADYRMYPDASFPDFIKDGAAVVSWAYKNMSNYGTPTAFFVGGSSAGGYLSQMLCFDKKYLAMHGIDSDEIDGYVHDAGQPTTHFNVLRERGIDTRRVIVDDAAPLYHITDGRNYAPMQIIVSEHDIQNRLEQTNLLISTLKHFGYEEEKLDFRFMKDFKHCCYVSARDENGEYIFANMVYQFIKNNEKGETV